MQAHFGFHLFDHDLSKLKLQIILSFWKGTHLMNTQFP